MKNKIQTCKYVRDCKHRTPEETERIRQELRVCHQWHTAIAERIAFLSDCLSGSQEVSFVHHGIVEEIDREVLAEDETAYCIRIRNEQGRVEYLTRSQLRK